MQEALISVIVPVYKVEKYLKPCVDSILNQTYKNLEIILVDDDTAFEGVRLLAKKEGLLVGISSGANLCAAKEISRQYPNKLIVTIVCDSGERYLSTELFD